MIFRLLMVVILFGLGVALFGGCDRAPEPVVTAPPAPPPLPPAEFGESGAEAVPAVVGPQSQAPRAEDQGTQSRGPSRSAASDRPPIHLSAGVAVPQLLPEGTQMGVSVDYEITGRLNSSRYVLVIESSAGQFVVPVTLAPERGTVQEFLPPSVRPEHKPFRVRIEERASAGNPVPASNTVPLQTSY